MSFSFSVNPNRDSCRYGGFKRDNDSSSSRDSQIKKVKQTAEESLVSQQGVTQATVRHENPRAIYYDVQMARELKKTIEARDYLIGDEFGNAISNLLNCIDQTNFSRVFQVTNYTDPTSMSTLVDELVGLYDEWDYYKSVEGFQKKFVTRFQPVLDKLRIHLLSARHYELTQNPNPNAIYEMMDLYDAPDNLPWLNVFKLYLNVNPQCFRSPFSKSQTRNATEDDKSAVAFLEEIYGSQRSPEYTDDDMDGSDDGSDSIVLESMVDPDEFVYDEEEEEYPQPPVLRDGAAALMQQPFDPNWDHIDYLRFGFYPEMN